MQRRPNAGRIYEIGSSVPSAKWLAKMPERGARLARRDEWDYRDYRDYLSEEQRRQPRGPQRGSRVGVEEGCPARKPLYK